jgi:ketosteroid isomerase-like protein
MNGHEQSAEDMAILEQLNLDYNRADQASDAKRFSEFLAEDFIVQTPGVTRNRDEYLEYIAGPRPFKDLELIESRIRLLGDVALIHGRARYTLLADDSVQEALYTDAYQKRGGVWECISACAIAPGS